MERNGEMLRCPWHGWEFDIKTGQSWCHPESVKARTYQVEVVPGETLAKGPFVAETVPVAVEQNYVVVELYGVIPKSAPTAIESGDSRDPASRE